MMVLRFFFISLDCSEKVFSNLLLFLSGIFSRIKVRVGFVCVFRFEFIIIEVELARCSCVVTKDGWHGYDKAML